MRFFRQGRFLWGNVSNILLLLYRLVCLVYFAWIHLFAEHIYYYEKKVLEQQK